MACCLTTPSHYLNQCWLIIGEVPWHSSQGIILWRCEDTNQYNEIENCSFKMASRSPRGQWVNRKITTVATLNKKGIVYRYQATVSGGHATRHHRWWLVDIGSGNSLVPTGIKPLPEPMLTLIYMLPYDISEPQWVKLCTFPQWLWNVAGVRFFTFNSVVRCYNCFRKTVIDILIFSAERQGIW